MESIQLLITKLSYKIKDLNYTFQVRHDPNNKNKLNFINTLYASLKNLNCKGLESAVSILDEDKITTVTKQALVQKRNEDKTYLYIQELNNHLIDIIYDSNNKLLKPYKFNLDTKNNCYNDLNTSDNINDNKLFINNTNLRFIGCDGFQMNVVESAINGDNIKESSSGKYGTIMISSLFDVMNNISINYHSVYSTEDNFNKKKVNETTGLLNQFNKLNSNDVVIMDKWYYAKNLHIKFIKSSIGYIFRVKDNSLLFRNLGYGHSKIIKLNGVDVQLFKYKIKNNQYNILTSITKKITIPEIKALYWKRWKIETDNKKVKCDILSSNIRSKTNNSINVDIECMRFISIISSIIEHIGKSNIKEMKKIHTINLIGVLYRHLLRVILYDNTNIQEICRLIGIIYKKVTPIINGRSYRRIRKSPSTKWNANGNRYGNKKE